MNFPHAPGARTRFPAILAAGLILGLAAAPAQAQLASGSNAPVDITADELEVVNADCLAIWRGSAEALQDGSRLRADVLRIRYAPGRAGATSGDANCCLLYTSPSPRD